MTKPFHIPLKAIALGVAIALAILAFSAKLLWDLREETWANARRSSGDIAATVSHDLARNFQIYNLSLQHVVDELRAAGVMELPVDMRDRVLFDRSTNATYFGSILVLDARGNVFIDSRDTVPRRENHAQAEFFRYHQEHPEAELHIGRPFKPAEGGDRITLSRRLEFGDGAFAGVVVGTIELAYFRDSFSKIDLGPQSGLTLTLADGTMLTRFPYRERDSGRNVAGSEVFQKILAMKSGNFVATASIDKIQRLYTFQQVGDFPLYLAVAKSTAGISQTWRERAWLIGLVTLALLAACGTLALILGHELHQRSSVESLLFEESERLRVTLGSIGDAVLVTDSAGYVTYLNPVAERMSGWTTAEARHKHSHEVLHITTSATTERVPNPVRIALLEERTVGLAADAVLHRRGGGTFAIEDSAAPIRDRDGIIIGAVMVFHDVSETRAMANRMSHLAQHDALTDLPNRVLLQDRLSQAIERGQRNGTQAALLFLDLDRFKHVNDSLGHAVGDQLLIETARRLVACVRECDTVSRLGGDEFVVLLSDLQDAQGPSRVAEKILRTLNQPFAINQQSLSIAASIGIAVYPRDGSTVDALTKNADAAMYLAKQSGRNGYRYFTSELGDIARRRLTLERAITDGLKRSEFILHYQPQFRSDGTFIGVEALVRWKRDGALVPPNDFIPFAEESGLIIELGDHLLGAACRQGYAWQCATSHPFTIAVNISAHQFRSPGFVERVSQILAESGLAPHHLELEITETALMSAAERTETILKRLKTIGVGIALDDFGTGYSSLSYLRRFPVDRIKIDKSFVHEIASSRSNTAIVEAVIGLGRNLGLRVIAEGVETFDQARVLTTLGCAEVQGYLTGRPGPAEDLAFAASFVFEGEQLTEA